MSDADQVAISRKKIEALERHARWFIEECKAGRILHIRDEDDLKAHGLMRAAAHTVLRDEVVRLTSNVSDEDISFLEAMMEGAGTEPFAGGVVRLEDHAAATFDEGSDDDAAMMEDALSEIITLRDDEDGPNKAFASQRGPGTVTSLEQAGE